MKLVLLILSFTTSIALAANLSHTQQQSLVEGIAKETRRDAHIGGYENVSTNTPELVNEKLLAAHLADNKRYENPLDSDEIAALQGCLQKQNCALWSFGLHTEYHSGTTYTMIFVLLNIETAKSEIIMHTVYAE